MTSPPPSRRAPEPAGGRTVAVSCPQGAEFGFAVVSDGMGGHAAGDLASRIIVAEVFAELTLRGRAALADPEDLAELLQASVETANASLQAQIEAYPDQLGMGGTVVATSLVDGGLQWVSVGDSLLYLLRDGMLKRLNDDHSMGPQIDLMAKNGMIDAEAARTHPQRNCLTSALTGKDIPELDCPPGGWNWRMATSSCWPATVCNPWPRRTSPRSSMPRRIWKAAKSRRP
jgi:serine/threonine protein phosphatase PrpC